jgi:hypothetical protein
MSDTTLIEDARSPHYMPPSFVGMKLKGHHGSIATVVSPAETENHWVVRSEESGQTIEMSGDTLFHIFHGTVMVEAPLVASQDFQAIAERLAMAHRIPVGRARALLLKLFRDEQARTEDQ